MRLRRSLLAILVGLNLALICQGHHDDNHHSGPHLTLLGEPRELPEQVDAGPAAAFPGWASACAAVTEQAPPATSHGYLPPSLLGAYALAPAFDKTQEIVDASTLDFLLLASATSDLQFQAIASSHLDRRASHVESGPDPPPPRGRDWFN
jgi:hypothetical protein